MFKLIQQFNLLFLQLNLKTAALYCFLLPLYFLSPLYFTLPLYFILAAIFCCHLNNRGNIKQRRKKTGDKIIKERQKNMQQLGMALLGFRNIYINELFSERDMNKNLIEYGLRELLTLAA